MGQLALVDSEEEPLQRKQRTSPALACLAPLGCFLCGVLSCLMIWRLGFPYHSPIRQSATQELQCPSTIVKVEHVSSYFPDWSEFKNVFFFGDSYTDTGFAADSWQPNATHPMGNGVQSTRTVWSEYLIKQHNSSALLGFNLARGGSTVDPSVVAPYSGGSSLKWQVEHVFLQKYARNLPGVRWQTSDTLFAVWFGVNDIFLCLNRQQPIHMARIERSFAASMRQLYAAGARNFVLLNVPPVDRSFNFHDNYTERIETVKNIQAFNSRLVDFKSTFKKTHPDAQMAVFDTSALYSRMMDDPRDIPELSTVTLIEEVCLDSAADEHRDFPKGTYCHDGLHQNQHFWQGIHPTYPVANATAHRVVLDCFGGGMPIGYCHA